MGPAPPEPATAPPDGDSPRTGWRALTVDLGPLRRHRDLRLLTISRGISFFGSMITYVGIPYQVFRLTHSSLAVGMLGAAELACLLSSAFVGGALADATDRRRLVLGTEAALALCSTALLVNAALARPRTWLLFVVAGAMAGLNGIQRPALQALIPRLVDAHELASTAAIGSLQGTVAMIVGPALAGLLIAGPGLPATFGVDVGTFALSAAPSAGAFLATVTSGWTSRVHRHGLAIAAAATLWGGAIVVFGLAGRLWLALAGLVVAGGADMVSGIFRMTMWNRTVPDSL